MEGALGESRVGAPSKMSLVDDEVVCNLNERASLCLDADPLRYLSLDWRNWRGDIEDGSDSEVGFHQRHYRRFLLVWADKEVGELEKTPTDFMVDTGQPGRIYQRLATYNRERERRTTQWGGGTRV